MIGKSPRHRTTSSARRRRRTVWVVAGVVVFVIGGAFLVGFAFQNRLIYYPTQQVPHVAEAMPGGEEVSFRTDDGLQLQAWFRPASRAVPVATVLVFNGNAGNRSDRVPLAHGLAAAGYSVLLVDYRGYGGNPGTPSEDGLHADATAALEYARNRDDVDPARIAYFGESLGSAVAVRLAVAEAPAALVLRSPFTSLVDVGKASFPFLPVGLVLRDHYASIDRIDDVNAPLLVIAGSADDIVPTDSSRRLFEAAPEPKRWLLIDGANHNDFELAFGPEVVDATTEFVREHLG